MSGTVRCLLSGTSPAAESTVAGATSADFGACGSLAIVATLAGATGGTLDVYLQFTPDDGATWFDYAAFPQLAAAAAATTKVWSVSRSAQLTSLTAVGSGTSPALAANTILGGDWGDRLRVVCKAGAGTSAGAAYSIRIVGTRAR